MKALSIAITNDDWGRLRRALFTEDGNENAAVLLCGVADKDGQRRLLARRISNVPDGHYKVREAYHLECRPAFYNQIVDQCLRERLQPILVHCHPHSDETGD